MPDDAALKAESRNDRKAERRAEAEARQKLSNMRKPIENRIAQLEQRLDVLNSRKSSIDARLTDADIYSDGRKDELKRLLLEQADLNSELEVLETEWLEKQAALEELGSLV